MFYGTIFTNLVVMSVVFDQDVPKHQVFNYPQLYREIQEGGWLTTKTFLVWVAKAIFQGAAIILLSLFWFGDSLFHLGTISFTALVLVEYLTIALVVRTWHGAMVLGLLLSVVSYLFCLAFLKSLFGLVSLSLAEYLKVAALVAISWLPVLLGRLVQRCFFPSNVDKLLREVRTQERRRQFIR
jgi:magnesium-transporting ATPase (P-type)